MSQRAPRPCGTVVSVGQCTAFFKSFARCGIHLLESAHAAQHITNINMQTRQTHPLALPQRPPRKKFTVIVLSLQVEGGTLKKESTGTIKYKFITFSLEASRKQRHKYFSKTAATIYTPPVLQNSLYSFFLFCFVLQGLECTRAAVL